MFRLELDALKAIYQVQLDLLAEQRRTNELLEKMSKTPAKRKYVRSGTNERISE